MTRAFLGVAMALTTWNAASGPGADFQTKVIVIADCDGDTLPKQSYRVMGDQAVVTATVQLDPTTDDRFQRIMRVHLSHPACRQVSGFNSCVNTTIYSDDLASVWVVHLMDASGVGGVAPEIQFRFIQAITGNQVKRATVLYKPLATGGSAGGIIQLHGWESTDLEIWGWIDPEINGLVTATVNFMVGVKMAPSSSNDVILNTDLVAAIP